MAVSVGPARTVAAVKHFEGGRVVVSVTGEVDLSTAPALEQTLRGVADDWAHEVIVDLTGCTFLDSQGLRALIATRRRLERSSARLALVVPDPSVRTIFRITQFDEPFEIYPSRGAAGNGNGHA